ncbi:MAG: PEP-CTERM sorting domain-containing protein [Spirulinaceae cyanobacterium]
MKGLLAKTAAAALVTTSLITFGSNAAQAQGRGGFDLGTDCNAGSVTTDIYSYAACSTNAGNDTGSKGTLLTQLGDGTLFSGIDTSLSGSWSILGKSDDGQASVTAQNGNVSGTWSSSLGDDFYGDVVVSVKAANGYFAYLFENVSGPDFGGDFSLANQKGLSHLTIATVNKPGGPGNPNEAVPEPFSMIGAGLALGAGVLLKNRKK